MTADAIVAPTDAQLRYIADLCAKQGWPMPPVYGLDVDLPEALRP